MIEHCRGIHENNLFDCFKTNMTAFKTNYYDKYRVVYIKTDDLNMTEEKPPYVVRGVDVHQIVA